MPLSDYGKIVWANELARARQLFDDARRNPGEEIPDYKIELDPEDFLDLCSGKWDSPANQATSPSD